LLPPGRRPRSYTFAVAASLQLKRGRVNLPQREGAAPVRDRLMAMLLLTAMLHAIVLLGLSFGASPLSRGKTPELDVMLVTDEVPEAKTNDRAAYLAQRTQIGSGNTDRAQRIASPASRGALASSAEDAAAAQSANAHRSDSGDQRILVTSGESPEIRYLGEVTASGAAALPLIIGDTEGSPRSGRGDAVELLLRGKSDAQHWVTPDTRASRLAPYLAAWKRKVERVGSLNFPTAARNAGLSGSPVVEVEIGANGKLIEAAVRRSSGFGSLDESAMSILKLASPFDPFPPDLAAEYSRLRFAYQWDFVAGALQTGVVTASSDTESGP
jgi:periplasmic protein TonB